MAERPVEQPVDNELRYALQDCRRILMRLQQISDAPTGRLDAAGPTTHYATSHIPPGEIDIHSDHAPSRRWSLYAHYRWRMERAAKVRDSRELRKLAVLAERDYDVYTGRRGLRQQENHEAAITELLRDYTGVSDLEASWSLAVPLAWVRRQRVLHGRDPATGESREADERTRRVLSMREAGASLRTIAAEVGVSHVTVRRILNVTA